MIFNSLEEAYRSREKFEKVYDQSNELSIHRKKYDIDTCDLVPKVGQFFLYEPYISKGSVGDYIGYPKLALYIGEIPIDQTIEVEYIDSRRVWENNTKFITSSNHVMRVFETPTKINSMAIWGNTLLIYGIWDKMPNWKELKPVYQKTWWFRLTPAEMRNRKINTIING
jgi:hypothetical protein